MPSLPEQADPLLIETIIKLTACAETDVLIATLKTALKHRLDTDSISIFQLVDKDNNEGFSNANMSDAMVQTISDKSSNIEPLSEHPNLQKSVRKQQPILKQEEGGPDVYIYPMINRSGVSHLLRVVAKTISEDQVKFTEILWKIWQHLFSLIERNELDGLTGLLNRVAFDNRLQQIFSFSDSGLRRENDGDPKVLALIDIDHFKKVNDEFGHLYGDEVLVQLSRILSQSFRGGDMVFRYGGEEFVVILRNCTIDDAVSIFNRFRELVEKHQYPQIGQKTVSIGITSVEKNQLPTTIIDRADKALYYSKENGRNQCSIYEELLTTGKIEKTPPDSEEVELF